MAPSRRSSNGRSPLVNQQSQITSFFSKKSSSSSPSPSPVFSKQCPKLKRNPNPNTSTIPSPSPSPTTPLPPQSNRKKPPLVIGPSLPSPTASAWDSLATPDTSKKTYGKEVVNRRIRVFWPLDQTWYGGCVKTFDRISGKHVIQYDDADEELLDLAEEKIQWVEEPVKKFRRLRRISVLQDENEEKPEAVESDGDDSTDEDWGKNAEKEVVEDVSEDMDLEGEEDDGVNSRKQTLGKKLVLRKRKTSGETISSGKKSKTGKVKDGGCEVFSNVNGGNLMEPINHTNCE